MDFNVKKLVRDAGTALSRVVQLTEEKLGTSEKTELDAHFENLAERSDVTKQWTEKIVRDTEAVLTPNPGNRVEDFLYEKIEKKRPNRLSNSEYLGLDMIEAGNEFGPGTSYETGDTVVTCLSDFMVLGSLPGKSSKVIQVPPQSPDLGGGSALIKVGQCQQRVGQIERDFTSSANHCFLTPLRKFLDGEMKTIIKERGILESKRLDLDACKNRVRKARSMLGQPTAERDLRVAQSEFDRQAEITKLLLEGVSSSHAGHLRCLHEFVEAQATYFAQCHKAMQDLQQDLTSDRKPSPVVRINSEEIDLSTPASIPVTEILSQSMPGSGVQNHTNPPQATAAPMTAPSSGQRARVLCDYDAKDASELSLMTNEVIVVYKISPTETDYMIGERNTQRGRVPVAFLELLN